MGYYVVLFISFFLFALLLRLSRSVFYVLAEDSVSLVNDLMSDLGEDEKVRKVQTGTSRLVLSLIKMLITIIFALVAGSVPIIAYLLISGSEIRGLDFTSFYAILSLSLGATVPFLLPVGKKRTSDYSELSQLLHRISLDNYFIANRLFGQETKKIKKKNLRINQDFVIISGLARAGTTSLMNDLARMDDFVSLSYANMPFLLCPNIWKKFYHPKEKGLKERSHKDGIMIGLNSNEALEEYFFKVKANDAYIEEDRLSIYELPEKDYLDYLDYQAIIKLDDRKTYLAKNNNFILRYKGVRAFNDAFIMVILYRDPLTHAASLMEKHREYKKLQEEDPFVLEYMDWLGHHEFGAHQKPFVFADSTEPIQGEKDSLDYWLKIWINYYRYALNLSHSHTLFINYDTYCSQPEETIRSIVRKAGMDTELPEYSPFHNKRKVTGEYATEIYDSALEVYRQLRRNPESARS
ncbi:MAG: hypothetical protein ACWGNV_01430 [Bacteroidales bacterium]